jgi:hypothetical protein
VNADTFEGERAQPAGVAATSPAPAGLAAMTDDTFLAEPVAAATPRLTGRRAGGRTADAARAPCCRRTSDSRG